MDRKEEVILGVEVGSLLLYFPGPGTEGTCCLVRPVLDTNEDDTFVSERVLVFVLYSPGPGVLNWLLRLGAGFLYANPLARTSGCGL